MKLQEVHTVNDPDEQEVSYVIFCDLDGVLANFKKEMNKIFHEVPQADRIEGVYDENRYRTDPKFRDFMWKCIKDYQEKHGQVVWRHLEPMADAMELWNYIGPKGAQILSATGQPRYGAAEQKRGWVSEHLGSGVRVNFTVSAATKKDFAKPNHVLIDDQARATQPFEAAGGIGIVHTSAANTIAQLKKLGI